MTAAIIKWDLGQGLFHCIDGCFLFLLLLSLLLSLSLFSSSISLCLPLHHHHIHHCLHSHHQEDHNLVTAYDCDGDQVALDKPLGK